MPSVLNTGSAASEVRNFTNALASSLLPGGRRQSGRIDQHRLQLVRQRPDEIDAGKRQQLVDLLHADLGLPFRHQGAHAHAELGLNELRLDLIGDAETTQHALEMNAARAAAVADGFGGEQRALERLGGADIGLRRARAHRHADAGTDEIDAAAGNHLAVLDQLVERRRRR